MAPRSLESRPSEGLTVSQKILIVRFSAIGDCVMTAHGVSALRRAHPDATLIWAVDPRCGAVLDRSKLLNDVFDVPREAWKQGGPGSSLLDQYRHFCKLRQYRFDVGVDLQGHSKTAICLRLAGAMRRLGCKPHDPVAAALLPRAASVHHGTHMVEELAGVLRPLGIADDLSPIMPELAAERSKVRQWIDGSRPLATISVSAGAPKKVYPLEHWKEVARQLMSSGFQVAFLGGPTDPTPGMAESLDWVAKTSLSETMAAVAESAVHFSADTGSGHIAAAYGVPVVSVFTVTNPVRYRPYTDRGVVLESPRDPSLIVSAGLSLMEEHAPVRH